MSSSAVMADSPRIMPKAIWTFLAVFFLLTYTTWAWGGLRPSYHRVGVGAAFVVLAALGAEGRTAVWTVLRRDPVFYLGLAFLAYLGVQWANAGRELYFDVGHQRWTYTPPPWPGWPSAFSRADAGEMLTWFFPVWVIAITIRSGLFDRPTLRRLLMGIVFSAGLLAVFGLIQYVGSRQAIYWSQPLQGHFFASFAYGNHAAPYFVLTGAMALGLLYREIFDRRRSHDDSPAALRLRHPVRVALLVPAAVLCGTGAMMGFSRTGVIVATALGLFAAAYLWRRAWPLLVPAGRLNLAALTLGVLGSLYFLAAGFGEHGIRKEFTLRPVQPGVLLQTAWDRIDLELGHRPAFARAAVAIWQEHPWFGVGGWGYKYRVADYVPETDWPVLETRGWANVHVDFLQFLAEFGVVGIGLLLAALGTMLRDLYRARTCRHNAFCVMGASGLVATVLFSLIDIPFRCPAILFTWVALLAAMTMFGHDRRVPSPAHAA